VGEVPPQNNKRAAGRGETRASLRGGCHDVGGGCAYLRPQHPEAASLARLATACHSDPSGRMRPLTRGNLTGAWTWQYSRVLYMLSLVSHSGSAQIRPSE